MAKYVIEDTRLGGIADEVRTLTGQSGTLTPAVMQEDLKGANETVTALEAKIEEILTELDGKATGGSGGDPTLPAGYVRCGYIRFNGEQIVDTGIVCTQDTKIRLVYTRDSEDAMYLYGVVNSGNTASVTAYLSGSGGTWRFGNKNVAAAIATDEELVQTAIVSKTGIVRPHLTQDMSSVNDFETIGSLLIGAVRNANGTVGSAQFIGKILLFQMWQGDTEVLHLTPVVGTDGVYRFYDEVTDTIAGSITDTELEGGNL